MANGRIWYNSINFKFTPTATTEETGAEVENVLQPFPFNVWRSTTNGTQYVTLIASTSRNIEVIYIGNHNLSTYTTFEIQCSNNNFSTHDDFPVTSIYEARSRLDSDLSVEDYFYRSAYAVIDGSYRYVRIKMDSTESYYEIGFIGIYRYDYTFPANWIKNFRWGWKTQNSIISGDYGSTSIKNYYSRREGSFEFKYITSAQALILTRHVALNDHVIFAPDGLGELYLVQMQPSDVQRNLNTISDDFKALDIDVIEKI
jgi:hypothetical protein